MKTELEQKLEDEEINQISDAIIRAIAYFKKKLEETNLQHSDVKAFGDIIADFANSVISTKLR